jgi:acetolactate synthase-1/2/3 large subunit
MKHSRISVLEGAEAFPMRRAPVGSENARSAALRARSADAATAGAAGLLAGKEKMKVVRSSEKKTEMTVARYLVSCIEKLGVDMVPVFQGGAIMKMIDEVGLSKKIKYICPVHEQALAMIVEAYARLRGFGVGMVTSGPGGMNLTTGIACAYYDSIPCLFITGQVGMFHVKGERGVRQRGFQESDMVSLLKPITKYAVLLDTPEDARYVFEKAVYLAKSGRPGPVMIDLPYNVQRALIKPDELRSFIPPVQDLAQEKDAAASAAAEVAKALGTAKQPVVLVGGGVRLAEQEKNLRMLVNRLKVPVVTTWAAADLFAHDQPLYIGNAGRSGNPSAVEVIQQSDVLVCLGTRFTPKIIINEKKFAGQARIISVDIDESELEEGIVSPHLKIKSDLRLFIPELLKQSERMGHPLPIEPWRLEARKLKREKYKIDITRKKTKRYLSPYEFVDTLSDVLDRRAIILPDAGANLTWAVQGYKAKPGQRFISAWGNSPMGYSFPAAIGACYGVKDKSTPVVAMIGDGGFQINIQELQTVATQKPPLKLFILNNQCLGNTKFGCRAEFQGRTHGNETGYGYTPPDFRKIVRAYGLPMILLKNNDNLKAKLEKILQTPGPVIVEVSIDPEQRVFELPGL